jgi:protocatechuate 3,4-dioxygenase beta subunit
MTPEPRASTPSTDAGRPRRVSRREALAGVGAVSLATLLAACGDDDGAAGGTQTTTTEVATSEGTTTVSPSVPASGEATALLDDTSACVLTPEQTEGPYYFDADAVRSDIREDREGTELRLAIRVRDAETCAPLKDAVVEIWHCDAEGLYSGFEDASRGGGFGGGRSDDERYLRGAQVTDAAGVAGFTTVYPGWYRGRAVHVHAKVHLQRTSLITTQLYFDEALTTEVFASPPYASRPDRDTTNDDDGFFTGDLVARAVRDDDAVLAAISFDVRT